MKAAFAVWNNRIAPVFDAARQVRIVTAESGDIISEADERLSEDMSPGKGYLLAERGVDTLVCGAITRSLLASIAAYGIEVVCFVAGDISDVIQAWLSGSIKKQAFTMPGCCRLKRRFRASGQMNREETIMNRIAVSSEGPSLDDLLDPRFGRAAGFIIADPETLTFEYVDNGASQAMGHGAGIQAAENVVRSGVKEVLTGSVGPKAFQVLQAAGIRIGQNLQNVTVRQALERYKNGQIEWTDRPNSQGAGQGRGRSTGQGQGAGQGRGQGMRQGQGSGQGRRS